MTVTYHVLWMLCALGALAVAAVAAQSTRGVMALATGFVLGAGWLWTNAMPDAPIVGVAAVTAAAVILFRPRYALAGIAVGGALGALWPELLWMQGITRFLAWPLVVALIGGVVWRSRRHPAFAPSVLRDDALLLVLGLGLVLAVLPGVQEGWQSALALNIAPAEGGAAMPAWLVAAVAASLALGAAHSIWSRR